MSEGVRVTRPRVAGIASNPAGTTFGPRQLRDFEFVLMLLGDAEYEEDGRRHALPEGSVVLCRPGVTDGFVWDRQHRSRHAYVHFDVESLPDDWPVMRAWPLTRALEPEDVFRPMFRHLLTHIESGPEWLTRMTLAHLLAVFVTGCTGASPLPEMSLPEPVRAAVEHLNTRLETAPDEPITLGDLADAACVTSEYLCRIFRRTTGRTPAQTVRLARLDLAASRLVRSNLSVAEVAASCGFASPFHFSRAFKQAFDISPSELRSQVRAGRVPPLPRLHMRL